MKNRYKRKACLLDDGVFVEGYTDKRGFHPNDTSCGFTAQKFRKKDIGKTIFYPSEHGCFEHALSDTAK